MAVYPKCEYLKVGMVCCSLMGIFPWQFMFVEQKRFQTAYALYSRVILGYYISFLISAYIKLFILFNIDDELQMNAISANICVTLIYTITVTRQVIMRNSAGFRGLIKHIIDDENSMSAIQYDEIDEIGQHAVQESKRKSKWYLYILIVVTLQYIVRPAIVQPRVVVAGNLTKLIKPLPLSSWFPFDEQEYYKIAYIWHILDCLVGASFVTYTDILMFNLIVFPIGPIKKLHHCLKNFDVYQEKFKVSYNIVDDEAAGRAAFIELISKHQQIIDYVNYFNDVMSSSMIFDFLQSSFQIATILTQVLGNPITLITFVFVGSFFVSMILRLILYYYHANDVMYLSERLSYSIWQSNWYEQPLTIKRMILMFIRRTQRPITYRIGIFSLMTLQSFISILRATYSYIMLVVDYN